MSEPTSPNRRHITRLRRIGGQINGIERMLDEGRSCIDVLNQLISVRKALKGLTEAIIHEHLEHCIDPKTPKTAETDLSELMTVLKRYVD